MKLETFFRTITIFGLIAIVIFIANAASAKPSRPQISSKVIRIEKKKRKPINIESKIKIEGREYNPNDRKLEEKFWELPLGEKRKYPMILRKRFINAKRRREYEEAQKKNPNRAPQPLPPYDEEELSILRSDNRKPSMAIQLDGKRYGKVSGQSKIGNKVINLEVK